MPASTTHLVLIPSYNSGALLEQTVREAIRHWSPVWVIVDGSTDGSERAVEAMCAATPGLRMLRRAENGGKGAAVFTGAQEALREDFTHALVMDADCQHPAGTIGEFLDSSIAHPRHLVLGRPVFGPEAPQIRLQGRKISIGLVRLETLGSAIQDPLFGFRVYPLKPLVDVMNRTPGGRHYDFDPEVAVRLVWQGVPTLNLPAACRYLPRSAGGISHFHYVRDNFRMIWLHTRLIIEFLLWRWWSAWRHRRLR
ncbi:MAG: glycosyltransferase family 2 protein [Opitutaceae bacterium]